MAILNKKLLLAVAIKVTINRRHRRRYVFQNLYILVKSYFYAKKCSGFFVNLIVEMQKDYREIYFMQKIIA